MGSVAYGLLPVRLIVTKKPNLQCFPNDKGIDTVIKYIYISPITYSDIIGFYYGCNQDNPSDSFVVNIGCKWSNNFDRYLYFMNNLDKGCIGDTNFHLSKWDPTVEPAVLYKGFTFDMGDVADQGCYNLKGNGILENDFNHIRISYSEYKTPTDYTTRVSKIFIGRRII